MKRHQEWAALILEFLSSFLLLIGAVGLVAALVVFGVGIFEKGKYLLQLVVVFLIGGGSALFVGAILAILVAIVQELKKSNETLDRISASLQAGSQSIANKQTGAR